MGITDTYLKNLKPNGTMFEHADRDGMSIRVSPKGKITFQYSYSFDGKRQRIKYGNYPQTSLKEARDAHEQVRKLLEQNINPVVEKQTNELASRDAETVDQLINEWMERYANVHRKCPEIPERSFKADVSPIIGKRKVMDITRRDVIKLLDIILDRGSNCQANKTLALLKQLFQYAVERGIIENSPISSIRKKSVGGVSKPRERSLSDDEIVTLWQRIEETPLSQYVIIATKLLLVTGQRRGEISKAEWTDIDLERKVWHIPEKNSKNGKVHNVPLSPMAISLLERLEELKVNDWVMPSPKDDTHMTVKAITRAIARYQDFIGVDKWTPHDLRRTCATKLAELGTAPHVVEKILNHTLEGVMAVYNRFDYMPERVVGLEHRSDRMELLVSNFDNVEVFKRSA
jgi:integrase